MFESPTILAKDLRGKHLGMRFTALTYRNKKAETTWAGLRPFKIDSFGYLKNGNLIVNQGQFYLRPDTELTFHDPSDSMDGYTSIIDFESEDFSARQIVASYSDFESAVESSIKSVEIILDIVPIAGVRGYIIDIATGTVAARIHCLRDETAGQLLVLEAVLEDGGDIDADFYSGVLTQEVLHGARRVNVIRKWYNTEKVSRKLGEPCEH